MPKGGVKDFVLSLLPELGTMGSNEGEVWVTGLSTLLFAKEHFFEKNQRDSVNFGGVPQLS